MWTHSDNGFALDGEAAAAWCRNLRLLEEHDWRLPSMDELAALYDERSSKAVKIRPLVELSGDASALWSRTVGSCCRQRPSRLAFDFADGSTRGGGQLPGVAEGTELRAVCVRGATKP